MSTIKYKTFKHEDLGKKEAVDFFNQAKDLGDVRYVINIYTDDILASKRKIEEITDYSLMDIFALNELNFIAKNKKRNKSR